MPWHKEKGGGTCSASQWAVIKDADGSTAGCHATEAEADAQIAALYANNPEAKADDDHVERRASVDNSQWDANAAMTACKTASDYRAICAGRREGDPALRQTWALPHHKRPGASPNADGVRSGLQRLPQTQGLVNKEEAQRHLDRHMSAIQAQAKAAEGGDVRELRAGVIPAGAARSLAFPSQLRAERVSIDGRDYVHIHGVASAYERKYEMWDAAGPYSEHVGTAAGAESLAKGPDVALLVNHKGIIMARTVNDNRPMKLLEAPQGLTVDAWVNPSRSDVRDIVTAIDDGDVTEMSFAFYITKGSWNDDFTEYRIEAYDIDRGDVSIVNYGANPYTSVAARSRELLTDLDQLPAGAARAAMERLARRLDVPEPAPPEPAPQPEPEPEPPAPQVEPPIQEAAGMSVELVRARLDLLTRG